MLVKKVNHNTVDVFLEKGWEFWGRFKIKFGKESNEVFQIKGVHFPKYQVEALKQRYNTEKEMKHYA